MVDVEELKVRVHWLETLIMPHWADDDALEDAIVRELELEHGGNDYIVDFNRIAEVKQWDSNGDNLTIMLENEEDQHTIIRISDDAYSGITLTERITEEDRQEQQERQQALEDAHEDMTV